MPAKQSATTPQIPKADPKQFPEQIGGLAVGWIRERGGCLFAIIYAGEGWFAWRCAFEISDHLFHPGDYGASLWAFGAGLLSMSILSMAIFAALYVPVRKLQQWLFDVEGWLPGE